MKIQCQCGAKYEVPDSTASRQFRCKKCAQVITVSPVASAAAASGSPAKPTVSTTTVPNAEELKRRAREDAILARFTSQPRQPTLEDRIAQRHRDSIESNRFSNSVKYNLIGVACIAVAIGSYIIMDRLEGGGVAPIIVWVLLWIGGKWWVPALLILIGVWHLLLGIGALTKIVDIDDEPQIPTRF